MTKKLKELRREIVDFDTTLLSKDEVPYIYVLDDELFKIKATIYGRGILIYNPDFPEKYLRFQYKKMSGKFSDKNIYLIEIIDVADKAHKSFYTKLQVNESSIMWYCFARKNIKKAVKKAMKSAWEVFTKHIFKIIIIALLTWASLYGAKYLKGFFGKIDGENLMKTIGIEVVK